MLADHKNQLTDFVPMTSFVYADRLTYDADLLLKGVDSPDRAPVLLRIAQWEIEKMVTWDADCIKAMFTLIGEKEDLKFKKLLSVFFVAIFTIPIQCAPGVIFFVANIKCPRVTETYGLQSQNWAIAISSDSSPFSVILLLIS